VSSLYAPNAANITDGTLTDDVQIPDDGDDLDVASILVALEYALDALAFLAGNERALTEFSRTLAMHILSMSAEFEMVLGKPQQTDDSAAGSVNFELDLPTNATLHTVTAHIRGGPAHGALPSTKPVLTIRYQNLYNDSDSGVIGTATANPASVAEYEDDNPVYQLAVICSDEVITRGTKRYFATLTGEAGANSEVGLKCTGLHAEFAMTSHDGAAA
jgi:hypothetical protein